MSSAGFSLASLLPAPTQPTWDRDEERQKEKQQREESKSASSSSSLVSFEKVCPPYGGRKGWVPRVPGDFGDGGAFPEIHVAQYPLDMGRPEAKGKSNALAVHLDAHGKVKYDLLAKQGHGKDKVKPIFVQRWRIVFMILYLISRSSTLNSRICSRKRSPTKTTNPSSVPTRTKSRKPRRPRGWRWKS